MVDLINQTRSKAIKGPGLKPAGIIILQFALLFLVGSFEYWLSKIGLVTGIFLIGCTIAGLILGREGTALTNAINPPIAFFFSTILILALFGGAGLHPNRIGLDLVTAMANVAPYLIAASIIGWLGFAIKRGR